MLRALVVVLLLANALVAAWSLGALDGLLGRRPNAEREPERLQRQVNPELVKLLPPAGASAPATGASQPSSAAPLTASPPLMAAAASAADGAPLCLEAGPLAAAALAGAEKALLAAGVAAGSWTTTAAAPKGVFLIYMGRYEDDEALQRKLEELKRRRIEARPVRHAELQPGIEVERFDDKDAAEEALARLSQRGLRTARVLTLVPPQPQLMLRLAAAEPARAAALRVLKLAPGTEGFVACAVGAAPQAGASAAMAIRTSAAIDTPPARAASLPRRTASAPGQAPASQATSQPTSQARPAPPSSAGLP